MNDRFFVTTMLGVSALVLTAGMSPLAQRTDQQAQVRTVNEIDAVGTAMFSWLTDQVGAAAAGQSQVDIANYPAISHADLEILLQPQYLENVPELDGWNHSYELYLNTANPQALRVMAGAFRAAPMRPGRLRPTASTKTSSGRTAILSAIPAWRSATARPSGGLSRTSATPAPPCSVG